MSIRILNKKGIVMLIFLITSIMILFGIWYKYEYSMDIINPVEYNSYDYSSKLLIATQGSEFKNALTDEIIQHYKNDSVFIKVIDVTSLDSIDVKMFNAILLIHTWENWQPPVIVEDFVRGLSNDKKNNLIAMTTSGQGSYKMKEVDAITGESNLNNVSSISHQLIKKLDPMLKSKIP